MTTPLDTPHDPCIAPDDPLLLALADIARRCSSATVTLTLRATTRGIRWDLGIGVVHTHSAADSLQLTKLRETVSKAAREVRAMRAPQESIND